MRDPGPIRTYVGFDVDELIRKIRTARRGVRTTYVRTYVRCYLFEATYVLV